MSADRCIACGAPIAAEGDWLCWRCKQAAKAEKRKSAAKRGGKAPVNGKAPMDAKARSKVEALQQTVGASAEMAHIFYTAMVAAGASPDEARDGMQAFVREWWRNAWESAANQQKPQEPQKPGGGDK